MRATEERSEEDQSPRLTNLPHIKDEQKEDDKVEDEVDGTECKLCGFVAKNKSVLINHKKQVHEKDLNCDRCDYTTGNKTNLQSHINVKHEGVKDFKCTECDFAAGFKY